MRLIRTLLDAEIVAENASWRERLHAMLGSENGGFEPYIKLWREAQIEAVRDAEIKSAYLLTMHMWHEETVAIIEQGGVAGEFLRVDHAADIAWRLIALVCGLDGMYVLGMAEMAGSALFRHLDRAIGLELFLNANVLQRAKQNVALPARPGKTLLRLPFRVYSQRAYPR